ncbi:MAG TPA: universal stress protein [Ilumatobacteraceae bacterium]|nr:universal stress protein [Ilumatobacteraceae bacterium]
MTTYLVGLDASDHARDALSWAVAVAREEDSVVAVHAWDLPVVTGYEAGAVDPTEAEASARDFVRSMVAEHDEGRVDARIADGPAGRALVHAAETLGPDVVVVVGHGGSGKTSLLLGSTAHHVVHHAHVPVVVVRGELRLPVRRLVVGVDGFDHDRGVDERSMAALRWALRLPGATHVDVSHADFVPAVAAGPVREPGLESDEETAEDDSRLRRAIEEATDGTGVAPNGAEIAPVVAAGTGAFAMIEASRDADLVVIGTRGRSGLLELIVGSTTLEVMAHAHCPVAVVR